MLENRPDSFFWCSGSLGCSVQILVFNLALLVFEVEQAWPAARDVRPTEIVLLLWDSMCTFCYLQSSLQTLRTHTRTRHLLFECHPRPMKLCQSHAVAVAGNSTHAKFLSSSLLQSSWNDVGHAIFLSMYKTHWSLWVSLLSRRSCTVIWCHIPYLSIQVYTDHNISNFIFLFYVGGEFLI